mmetsp:Transcript_3852/g.9813  ORF Transcript_3852/g.9813 Transcript_3852/m.9813 type:complete len:371 (-) Transcript_3852:155-1267(-)
MEATAPSSARLRSEKGHASTTGLDASQTALSGTHPYLSSKFQIGSVKSQRINFSLNKKVFHSGDVLKDVLDAKRAVQKTKQSNILGTEQREWNMSSIADPKIHKEPEDLKRKLLKVRAGLLDEYGHSKKPPKNHSDEAIADMNKFIVGITGQGPIGKCTKQWFNAVDERGLCKHSIAEQWNDWNPSTSSHTKEDKNDAQQRLEERMQRQTRMLQKNPKLAVEKYVDPVTAISNVNDRLRERKIDFQELKEQFKKELKVEFPQASEERLQAMAQRLLNEKLLADEKMARFPVHSESFRPNLSLTCQDRRYKAYFHPGAWSWQEAAKRNAWSCCLNFGEDSRGCEYRIVNPDAWCTLGYERQPGMAAAGRAS